MDEKSVQGKLIVERLEKACGVSGNTALGDAIGKSDKVVWSWRNGGSLPKLEDIPIIAGKIGLSVHWILTGEGPMKLDGTASPDKASYAALGQQIVDIMRQFEKKEEPKLYALETQTYQGKPIPQEMAQTIPVFTSAIAAGKPGESSCAIEEYITISACRVKHPMETYAVKAHGDSMKDAGILEGDLLIVDRAIEPKNNHIVIASIDNELTVKRLRVKKGAISLVPENQGYKPIEITSEMDFRTLGVVTYVIRKT
jgi:DNA polymerase V